MARVTRLDEESVRRLRRLRVRLADVSAVPSGAPLPAWNLTRLNSRYHNALRLAEIVWRATALDQAYGSTVGNGFLFDMWRVFEDFVTVAIGEHLSAHHLGNPRSQYRAYLDVAGSVPLRPDFVWERAGRPNAVVDAKYKLPGYPNADLYQMLAYCTALGVPRGHLIYAAGATEPARHVVRQSGTEIHCHALDLSRPPPEILATLARIGDAVLARSLTA